MKIILTKQKHWAFGAWSSAWLQSIRFNLISSAMDIAYTPDSLITSFSFVVFENDANHTPGKASRKTAVSVLILIGFACIPRHAPTGPTCVRGANHLFANSICTTTTQPRYQPCTSCRPFFFESLSRHIDVLVCCGLSE